MSVSVVVPFYNRSFFFERLLKSVLSQTLLPRVLYLVDNGSEYSEIEQCFNILSKYDLNDLNGLEVVIVSTLSRGNANYARNLGMELASTKYLAFLDSDDWWTPAHLEVSIDSLRSSGKAAVYSGAIIHAVDTYCNASIDVNSLDSPFGLIFSCGKYMAQTSSYVVELSSLRSLVSWDVRLKRHQDYDFFLSVFYATKGWCFLSEPSSHIDWNAGGAKGKIDYRSMIKFIMKWRACIPVLEMKRYVYDQLVYSRAVAAPVRYIMYYKATYILLSARSLSSLVLCSELYLGSRACLITIVDVLGVKGLARRIKYLL